MADIPSNRRGSPRWQAIVACCSAIVAWTGAASTAPAAQPSYVFFSEYNSDAQHYVDYLAKYDGTSTDVSSPLVHFGNSSFIPNLNSSGSGLSLLTQGGAIYVANPGTPAGGGSDLKLYQVTGNSSWAVNPVGRHGSPNETMPDVGIFRGTISGGVTSTPNINSPPAALLDRSTTSGGVVMGDFAHDIVTGDLLGTPNTYILAHNSNAYIDLGAFAIEDNRALQAGSGAIIEIKGVGGVLYVDSTGAMTQLINPETSAPFTTLDNGIGGKLNDKGFFNADGKAWYYDATANTVNNWSSGNITSYVRVGGYSLIQDAGALYLWNGSGAATEYAPGPDRLTAGLSFGDYAFGIYDGSTRILRDNGAGIDDAPFSGQAYDLTRATGGYLGVVDDVSVPGDYNIDGFVNEQDYETWKAAFGSNASPAGAGADGNFNGVIDAADYVVWRKLNPAGDGSASALAVPEPSTAILLQIVGLLCCVLRNSHHHGLRLRSEK